MHDTGNVEQLLQGAIGIADARQALLDAGWEPVSDADCRRNVLGDDWQAVCAAEPQRCLPCEQPIGLAAAGADGHVLFRFRHPASGERIEVTGYGLLEDWDVRGEQSRLEYVGWRAMEPSAP